MAATQKTRVRQAAANGRPLRDANFLPRRERKAVRKGLVRAALANRVADVKVGAAARMEFYRNLRHMKERRRLIAHHMFVLSDMVVSLERLTVRASARLDRVPSFRSDDQHKAYRVLLRAANDSQDALKVATAATAQAADEFALFARRKIYYTEVAA